MRFSEAMAALEEGKKVRCITWNQIIPDPISAKTQPGVMRVFIDWLGPTKTMQFHGKCQVSLMLPIIKRGGLLQKTSRLKIGSRWWND